MTRLGNGMRVCVRESPDAPVVALNLLVAAGSLYERAETNGATALLGRVLLKGTRSRSALQIAQAAEDAGGAIESGSDQEYTEIRAYGLARAWRELLALVHGVATAPSLPPEEVERERGVLIAQIRGLDDEPFQVANRVLSRALYGSHGYGLPTSGDAESVGRLTRADLVQHFETCFGAGRMVLGVSGQVKAAAVVAEASALFGGLAAGVAAPASPPPPSHPVRERDGETRPVQQAHLLVGFFAPALAHPDHAPAKVVNALLGGGMSGRLFRTLRDAEGLAYSVGSAYPTRRGTGRIVVHMGTAPENLGAAEAGVRREVRRLGAERAPEDEIARTKAHLTGTLALDGRTNGRQSFYLAFFELMGVGADYMARYPTLIETVDAADVQRVAARYLTDPSVVVVGPD